VLIVPSALKDAFVDLSTKPDDELLKAVCPYMYESKLLYSCKIKNSRQIINETILIIENINQYRLRIITQN
jgi:hypothetical protein